MYDSLQPEEKARKKIDTFLRRAGWDSDSIGSLGRQKIDI